MLAADVLEDVAEPDRQRALVTLIGQEANDGDVGNDLTWPLERRRRPLGAVVDHDEGNRPGSSRTAVSSSSMRTASESQSLKTGVRIAMSASGKPRRVPRDRAKAAA